MSQATQSRLKLLERVQHRHGQSIPPEQRLWCDLCATEAERQACLTEPVTWAEVAAEWDSALDDPEGVSGGHTA